MEYVNVGTTPNDNTGDLLRDAFIKINADLVLLEDKTDEIDYAIANFMKL